MSMQVVLEALRRVGDDTSPRALAKALDETKIQGYLGDFYFADARVGVGNYIVHKAIKVGGDYPYQTEVLAKYQIRPELVGRDLKYRVNKVEMLK